MTSQKNSLSTPFSYAGSYVAYGHRFWNCPVEATLFDLPLIVSQTGTAQWTKGFFCDRKKSQIFSVELVVGGDADYTQNGRHYIVKPGQVFLAHKDCDHYFKPGPSGYLHKRMALMEGIALKVILQSLGLLDSDVITLNNPKRLISLIKSCYRLMSSDSRDFTPAKLSLVAYEILLELGENSPKAEYPAEVSKSLSYMSQNMNRSLTLSEIAKASGVSMYHFSRLFQKSLQCSPMSFYFQQKMSFAKNLLRDSGLLIKEIALLLGYDDPFYFTAQFTKFTGVSPREYRKKPV